MSLRWLLFDKWGTTNRVFHIYIFTKLKSVPWPKILENSTLKQFDSKLSFWNIKLLQCKLSIDSVESSILNKFPKALSSLREMYLVQEESQQFPDR